MSSDNNAIGIDHSGESINLPMRSARSRTLGFTQNVSPLVKTPIARNLSWHAAKGLAGDELPPPSFEGGSGL